jgi:hypothetical protein
MRQTYTGEIGLPSHWIAESSLKRRFSEDSLPVLGLGLSEDLLPV